VKNLEESGAEVIVIACNTVHLFYDEMLNEVNIPILSMIEATVEKVKEV
jgi:aspartate racemase